MSQKKVASLSIGIVGVILVIVAVVFFWMQSNRNAETDRKIQLIENFSIQASVMTSTDYNTSDETESGFQEVDVIVKDAVEGAFIDFEVNGNKYKTVPVENTESFDLTKVPLNQEGENVISAQQYVLRGDQKIYSTKKDELKYTIDTIAPDVDIQVLSDVPAVTNNPELPLQFKIKGDIADVQVLRVNDVSRSVEKKKVALTYTLQSGRNELKISVADLAGNVTEYKKTLEVVLDDKPPKIVFGNSWCSDWNKPDTSEDEIVCVEIAEFYGPLNGYATAPISGKVVGSIKEIIYDGNILDFDNGVINQKISLYMNQGTNHFNMRVTDAAGNVSTDLHDFSWDDQETFAQNDIEDSLEDIENQLDDLDRKIE